MKRVWMLPCLAGLALLRIEPALAIPNGPELFTHNQLGALHRTNAWRHFVAEADLGGLNGEPARERVREFLRQSCPLLGNADADTSVVAKAVADGVRLLADGVSLPQVQFVVGTLQFRLGVGAPARDLIAKSHDGFGRLTPASHYGMLFSALNTALCYDQEGVPGRDGRKAWQRKTMEALALASADDSFRGESKRCLYDLIERQADALFFRALPELLDVLKQTPGADPYALLLLEGTVESDRAFEARGSKYAAEVTDAQWQGFREHLGKARAALTKACELHPDYPYAPSHMITVAHVDGVESRGARRWFDRTVATQIDYLDAYTAYRWSLLPKWGGSTEEMLKLGFECLETRRFDTDVPLQLLNLAMYVTDIAPNAESPLTRPDVYSGLVAVCQGYVKANPDQPKRYDRLRFLCGTLAWQHKDYAAANACFRPDDSIANPASLCLNYVAPYRPIAESRLYAGPQAARYAQGVAALADGRYDEADACWAALSAAYPADPVIRVMLEDRQNATRMLRAYDAHEWVEVLPEHALLNWNRSRQVAWQQDTGRVVRTSVPYGQLAAAFLNVPLKGDFEVLGVVDMTENPTAQCVGGLVISEDPETRGPLNSRALTAVLRPNSAGLCGQYQTDQMLKVGYAGGNLLRVHLCVASNRYSLAVNGHTLLYRVGYPLVAGEQGLHLGIGVYNGIAESVSKLAYRDLRVRRLRPEEPARRDGLFKATYTGVHPGWLGPVYFDEKGAFRRDNGDGGTYQLTNGVLKLNWASWGPAELTLDEYGVFREKGSAFRLCPSIAEQDPR